ncbi:MAG: tetratricopeptide repeat protein [Rhodospirillales bacterium]|nr:tetratricopeptide repeat protein [Rhodospirillales bacterium]
MNRKERRAKASAAPAMGGEAFLQAVQLHRAGRLAEAEALYRQALARQPNFPEGWFHLGELYQDAGRLEPAAECYQKSVAQAPGAAEPKHNLATVLSDLGRREEALALARQAAAIRPDLAPIQAHLGRLLFLLDRVAEARAPLQKALERDPDQDEALRTLGVVERHYGRLAQSDALLARRLARAPDDRVALLNRAMTLKDMGRYAEALPLAERALAQRPQDADARWHYSHLLLQMGRLEEGWRDFAWRWAMPSYQGAKRSFRQPAWNGVDDLTDQRVLVWPEQGVGDEITFASALGDLAAKAKRVIVECAPKIRPILARSFPDLEFHPADRSRDASRDDFDIHLPVGDLFAHFRKTIDAFPKRDSYLVADPEKIAHWQGWLASLGPGQKIGIAWRSTLVTPERARHFFQDLSGWGPILQTPGQVFVILQPGATDDEIKAAEQAFGLAIHRPPGLDLFDDLDGVAALMAALDRVVGNGSVVTILSAALGRPTLCFLLRHAHWDWFGTESLAWIPKLEILARNWDEGWEQAIGKAAARLGGPAT